MRPMPRFTSRLIAAVALATGIAAASLAQTKTGPTGWPSTNYVEGANRYSPLTQITPANVTTLQRAWSIHLKPAGYSGKLREDEAIPIVIGGTMYLGSPYGAVLAFDAASGAEKWRFQLPNDDIPAKPGVAYWPGGCGRPAAIVFGSNAGRLYSIVASDGTLNHWFGDNGIANLKTPEVMLTGMTVSYSLLSSPTIYKNLIITGAGTGEGPGGSNGGSGPAGDTPAWDATTGKLVWTFHTAPGPGGFGDETWGENTATKRPVAKVCRDRSLARSRGI